MLAAAAADDDDDDDAVSSWAEAAGERQQYKSSCDKWFHRHDATRTTLDLHCSQTPAHLLHIRLQINIYCTVAAEVVVVVAVVYVVVMATDNYITR